MFGYYLLHLLIPGVWEILTEKKDKATQLR